MDTSSDEKTRAVLAALGAHRFCTLCTGPGQVYWSYSPLRLCYKCFKALHVSNGNALYQDTAIMIRNAVNKGKINDLERCVRGELLLRHV